METYHLIPAGSSGKKATALLVSLLAEDGLLDLDAPISMWLPEELLSQIQHSDNMTIRTLLNHTSGIFDYLDPSTAREYFEAIQMDTTSLKTDIFPLQFTLNKAGYFAPGEGFKYSNTGYLLAGLIMDQVLGEHHSVALRNRVIDPIGMISSYYSGVEKERGEIISGYYTDVDGEVIQTKSWYENIGVADAPLVSSVNDMALLLKTIIEDETLISQEVRDNLFGSTNLITLENGFFYGLGIYKENFNGKLVYHHNGLEIGYSTVNIYIPESKTSITAFLNCGGSTQCESEIDGMVNKILAEEL